jgi:hypothetical protein
MDGVFCSLVASCPFQWTYFKNIVRNIRYYNKTIMIWYYVVYMLVQQSLKRKKINIKNEKPTERKNVEPHLYAVCSFPPSLVTCQLITQKSTEGAIYQQNEINRMYT